MAAGEKQRATINNVELDFTGLFSTSAQQSSPATGGLGRELSPGGTPTPAGNIAPRTGLEGQQAKRLYIQSQREEEAYNRSLEIYKTYQENIRASEQLQTEILKGSKAKEDIYTLFLKAVKAISLMTSNAVFYDRIAADLSSIYGADRKPEDAHQA